jgi:hypothetical protein
MEDKCGTLFALDRQQLLHSSIYTKIMRLLLGFVLLIVGFAMTILFFSFLPDKESLNHNFFVYLGFLSLASVVMGTFLLKRADSRG